MNFTPGSPSHPGLFYIKGNGSDDVGQYNIDGKVTASDGVMTYNKKYVPGTGDCEENLGHTVSYKGTLQAQGQGFKGTWSVNNSVYTGSGPFQFYPVAPKWNPVILARNPVILARNPVILARNPHPDSSS